MSKLGRTWFALPDNSRNSASSCVIVMAVFGLGPTMAVYCMCTTEEQTGLHIPTVSRAMAFCIYSRTARAVSGLAPGMVSTDFVTEA